MLVSVHRLTYWCAPSVYNSKTDLEPRECYDLGCYKCILMQLSICVGNAWSEQQGLLLQLFNVHASYVGMQLMIETEKESSLLTTSHFFIRFSRVDAGVE